MEKMEKEAEMDAAKKRKAELEDYAAIAYDDDDVGILEK